MRLFSKKHKQDTAPSLPVHLAIIMDGNGRWAKKRGLPRSLGHSAGANNFRTITKYCAKIGIKYLTVFAFSTENWKRPQEEVNALMKLFDEYLQEALHDFAEENIRVLFLGERAAFSQNLQRLIGEVEEASKDKTGMTLNIAMNYGSRAEILRAAKQLARQVQNGELRPDDITQEMFAEYLYTKDQPDPDLILRPSGEYRISNFLLWQSAYAEFIFMDKLWPDFKTEDLDKALHEYSLRNRRFGGV